MKYYDLFINKLNGLKRKLDFFFFYFHYFAKNIQLHSYSIQISNIANQK